MPAERYYYPNQLETEEIISLQDQEFHHLVHVMRAREGETIEVVNGMGQLAQASIQRIEKKKAILSVRSLFEQKASATKMILAQGIPRQNRLDFIVEKCTELGMTEIWLFPATKSEKKEFSENQLERLKGMTIAAMKQCGRLFLPTITLMPHLKKWNRPEDTLLFYGDTNPNAPSFLSAWRILYPSLAETDKGRDSLFFIGPESGFTEEEITILKELGAHGVSLHSNILRTDTAAIAAIVMLSSVSQA